MSPLKLILLVLLSLQFLTTSARQRCSPVERSALLSIDPEFSPAVAWNASEDCCTWYGVECDPATAHVIGITFDIFDNPGIINSNSTLFSLRGLKRLEIYVSDRVPMDVAVFEALFRNLTDLTELSLNSFDLSSVPPAMLTNLSSSLTLLKLSDCLLQGELPDHFFPSFPVLETLDLSNNNLIGHIPLNLSNSKSLASLFLSNNSFHGPLPEFGTDLSSMTGLPLNLMMLELYRNSIEGPIPSWIYALPYLEYLDLTSNRFSGEIGDFKTISLKGLQLEGNRLRGVIPKSIFRQSNLSVLTLSSNSLTGDIPLPICNLTSLTGLDLSHNILSGKIPLCMSNLSSLDSLSLKGNKFHGTVSSNIANNIDLSSNFFSGPCPIPPKSQYLRVSENNFSGEIPESVCSIEFLITLDLSDNELSGTIPWCMGNISNSLQLLDLQRNKLHGSISLVFSKENLFKSLHLNGNQFEGPLPRSLANCTELEVLDLGDNQLNDTFPNWLESIPELKVLVLRANMFHGPISNAATKSPFPKLTIMDLSRNKFAGELPIKYFENFRAMQAGPKGTATKYIEGDYLYQESIVVSMKGTYFELVKILITLTVLDFSGNNFTGEIPWVVGRLDSLKGLNLSHNSLGGSIPTSMRNLTNLEWLDLSSNQLVGHIPAELANIPGLSFLNLSHNRLTGMIPNGKQFNTFTKDHYVGNLALCGFPMSEPCGSKSPQTYLEPNDDGNDDDDDDSSGFSIWKLVVMGFASGFVIGVSLGYVLMFSDGKLSWISEQIMGEPGHRRSLPNQRIARSLIR